MILGLVCIIAGFFISFNFFIKWEPRLERIKAFIEKYGKYVGIVSIFFGIMNFFGPDLNVVQRGNNYAVNYIERVSYPIIGDLLPAIFAFIGGIILFTGILNFINIKEEVKLKINEYLNKYKIIIGFGNILLGFIHLFTPGSILF